LEPGHIVMCTGCGKADMHDLMLAKEITKELLKIISEKKLEKVKSVSLEIGNITHGDHTEDIDLGNLTFLLESITQKYGLNKAKYEIKKTSGSSWKITKIEV
jgi:Zn finger protein HypA/HybF involved in hydrogenase expression